MDIGPSYLPRLLFYSRELLYFILHLHNLDSEAMYR